MLLRRTPPPSPSAAAFVPRVYSVAYAGIRSIIIIHKLNNPIFHEGLRYDFAGLWSLLIVSFSCVEDPKHDTNSNNGEY